MVYIPQLQGTFQLVCDHGLQCVPGTIISSRYVYRVSSGVRYLTGMRIH